MLIYLFNTNIKLGEAKAAIMTISSLAIWAFAYTFFYSAPTEEVAWFWHRIGMIGGCLFPAFSVYYYFCITKTSDKISKCWIFILFGMWPLVLTILNLVFPITSCAYKVIQSSSGLGWTYLNTVNSVLYWVYIFYIMIYFSIGFFYIYKWGKTTEIKNHKKQAKVLLLLFGSVLFTGIFLDFILPLVTSQFPPMAGIMLIFVLFGFWLIFGKYGFFSLSSKTSSQIIFRTIMDPVLMIDLEGNIIRVNLATTDTFGYSEKDLINKKIDSLFVDKHVFETYLGELVQIKSLVNKEADMIDANHNVIHVILSASIAEDGLQGHLGTVISIRNITDRKQMEAMWREGEEKYKKLAADYFKLANYDVLTGLPNRRYIIKKISQMQSEYIKNKDAFALVFLDLNDFKKINDEYGHDVGDELLKKITDRLQETKDESDILARMGGDEFVILITKGVSDRKVNNKINRIKMECIRPLMLNGKKHKVSIAAGYAMYSNKNKSIIDLLSEADKNMYKDKERKHSQSSCPLDKFENKI